MPRTNCYDEFCGAKNLDNSRSSYISYVWIALAVLATVAIAAILASYTSTFFDPTTIGASNIMFQ